VLKVASTSYDNVATRYRAADLRQQTILKLHLTLEAEYRGDSSSLSETLLVISTLGIDSIGAHPSAFS
jgi:hypothetical protein